MPSPPEAGASIHSDGRHWSPAEEDFWWACESDDLVELQRCLTSFPTMPLTTLSPKGVSPLFIAAHRSSNDVLELLVLTHTLYVDVDQQNAITGLTPMHACAKTGNLEGMKALVKKGADVNALSSCSTTPLAAARHHQNREIELYLLSLPSLSPVGAAAVEKEETWECRVCTKENAVGREGCEVCGRRRAGANGREEEEGGGRGTGGGGERGEEEGRGTGEGGEVGGSGGRNGTRSVGFK